MKVVLEQISSGVAISCDWYMSVSKENESDSENENEGGLAPLSARSYNVSNYSSSIYGAMDAMRKGASKGQKTVQIKEEEILMVNAQIYEIICNPNSKESEPEFRHLKVPTIKKGVVRDNHSKIFTTKCLFPFNNEENNGGTTVR